MTHATPRDPLASLHHDGSARYVQPLAGADPDHWRLGDEVRIRIRAGLDAPIERILLRTCPDGEQAFLAMTEVAPGPACRWWEATLRLTMPTVGYRFMAILTEGYRWLNGLGLQGATPTDANDFRLLAGYDAPGWLDDRVFYQIFPDRFANGDPTNDVRTGAWTYRGQPSVQRAWDVPPTPGPGALVEFYGGDLQGIVDHLDHIETLGANALYLTPVFDTRSNHGYDIIDYEHVAAHFGGDEAMISLREATAARDIRLMLDVAPNHIGVEHAWFRDAQADAAAATAAYFIFRQHPDDYESWLGHDTLPKLDYRSLTLRHAIYAGPDSVLRRWLKAPFGIDAWRLDVANMLGRSGADQLGAEVGRGIRDAVRAEAPTAFILGENTYDGTQQLAGDQWDSVMNYSGFSHPVLHWLAGADYWSAGKKMLQDGPSSTDDLLGTLDGFRAAIPWTLARQQYNLVGSHDTSRVRTVVGGDPGRLRAALGLTLTYVGIPSLVYGDEIGLEGRGDIAARRTMPWDEAKWDADLFAFTKQLIRARRSSAALRAGGYQVLAAETDTVVFLRDTEDDAAIVVVHRGPDDRPAAALPVGHGAVADGMVFSELFGAGERPVVDGHLDLPAMAPGIAIWQS